MLPFCQIIFLQTIFMLFFYKNSKTLEFKYKSIICIAKTDYSIADFLVTMQVYAFCSL